MRAVIQRVKNASVQVEGSRVGAIDQGLLVYLGVALGDDRADAAYLAEKTAFLRIFEDTAGKMNLSVQDTRGGILVISQFTLLADARKGRRPSYSQAAAPESAKTLYEYFIEEIKKQNIPCESGQFQTHMEVSYTNDGPVTILLDSKQTF